MTCSSCGRAVLTTHVDSVGRCCFCQAGLAEAAPVTPATVSEPNTPEQVEQAWQDLGQDPGPSKGKK